MANANPDQPFPAFLRENLAVCPGGRLPWAEVMRMALYEPGLGYYRQGVRRVGRGGDFYTSVSVGPVFGALICQQVRTVWAAMGSPPEFAVIEQGAHDGALARDILTACAEDEPDLAEALRYIIIEPDPVLRTAQEATLAGFTTVQWVDSWAALPPVPAALFLCNELVDAFPAHRIRWTGEAWRELHVTAAEDAEAGAFAFVEAEPSRPDLAAYAATLSTSYPAGYTTDVCLEAGAWVAGLADAPFTGAALIFDYGLPEMEYLAPERHEGTLRRYLRHTTDGRVLEDLGEADLTTDVNFTALAREAEVKGMALAGFIEQGRFLTRLFTEHLTRHPRPMDAATRRQLQTLTHPGLLGRNFHALTLAKGMPSTILNPAADLEAARRRLGL